jgi:hypothetical protein
MRRRLYVPSGLKQAGGAAEEVRVARAPAEYPRRDRVFRHPLRGIFLLLSLAGLAAPLPAAAVLDIDQVTLSITIERTTLGADAIRAELRVTGTDLNSGTIALPSAPAVQVPFDVDGDDLVIDDEFASEAELNSVLSNGNYVLRVNNGNAQSTIPYTRPTVPNPTISQPGEGEVVPPGPLEVLFTRCSQCNLPGDSVEAVLEDDMGGVLEAQTLDEDAESWIPGDGMGGDLALPESSAFVVRVTHEAVRLANVAVSGDDDDDNLVFTSTFTQSDEVDFETGFAPPSGHFCLAVSFPAPPPGCETLADPLLQLFDTSGMFSTQVDGHDVDVVLTVGPGGQLTGTATADLDDAGINETGPAPLKGKLGGSGGEIGSKLSFSLANEGLMAKLKVSITDTLFILGDTRDRVQSASGSLGGVKIKESMSSSDSPLPDPPLGWLLEYDLAADGTTVSNAELVLEGGRTFPLTGTNKFNFSANQSSLKLSSDPKGISITLKKLGLDAASDPMEITEGDMSYKALGQSGRAVLP